MYLEKKGELGVPVVNEMLSSLCLVHKGVDDVAENKKRFIDIRCFTKAIPYSIGVLLPFWTCQVNEVELGLFYSDHIPVLDLVRDLVSKNFARGKEKR